MQQTYTLPDDSKPERLDAFLASTGTMKSREKVKEAIKSGFVTINDVVITKPAAEVLPGDTIMLDYAEDDITDHRPITPHDLHLIVLYEDDACMVIAKPRNITVHPAVSIDESEPTILHGAAFLFTERKLPFSASETLVHRLDKETTGALLLAKNPRAHLALQQQFADRTVKKEYLALIDGIPAHEKALIDAPIGRNTNDRTKMSVHGLGVTREARTTYEVLASHKDIALVKCDLHTGRTHQIRVHMKSIGHAILGDTAYDTRSSIDTAARHHITSLCLHAWKLGFVSPATQENVHIVAPLPKDIADILQTLDWLSLVL